MSDNQLDFHGMINPIPVPLSEDDWFSKMVEISQLFSPTAPVEETELFAGRSDQLKQLIDTVFQRGQHAVIYGDRGVGKTSLANTFRTKLFRRESMVKFFPAQCFAGDTFTSIWERAAGDFQLPDGTHLVDEIDDALTPASLMLFLKKIPSNVIPVFIFDEFDRLIDAESKLKMAETIKLLSDVSAPVTIIIVGIGRTISDLLDEHRSVDRALRQVEMPRMSEAEIRSIVGIRLARAGMSIRRDTLDRIVILSRGMPGYAHLLGMHAAKAAIDAQSMDVEDSHLWSSLATCLREAAESTRQTYAQAIQSSKPNNQFRQVLLACALATQDEYGAFTSASVRGPVSSILGEEKDIPAFARHIKAFCSERHGAILEQNGTPKNYRFNFTDPMMQSYVIMKGLLDGLINHDDPLVRSNLV